MNTLREQVVALYETARTLTLIKLADTGHALAAWAEARDLDLDWADFQKATNGPS